MRMKHADAPERFMDSEVDLDEAVKRLLAVSLYVLGFRAIGMLSLKVGLMLL